MLVVNYSQNSLNYNKKLDRIVIGRSIRYFRIIIDKKKQTNLGTSALKLYNIKNKCSKYRQMKPYDNSRYLR